MVEYFVSLGYLGMFIASFIAGSVLPFSSEAVVVALQLLGLAPLPLFLSATVGNVLGSMFDYWLGSLGNPDKIQKWLHISEEKMQRTARWMKTYGAWLGFFCFVPILGTVISVTLGYMRANPWISLLSITIGKALRYAILIYVVTIV